MAFAMKGGGSRVPLTFFQKCFFVKTSKRVCTFFGLYIIHVVVEVTMNMAEYTISWQSATL